MNNYELDTICFFSFSSKLLRLALCLQHHGMKQKYEVIREEVGWIRSNLSGLEEMGVGKDFDHPSEQYAHTQKRRKLSAG